MFSDPAGNFDSRWNFDEAKNFAVEQFQSVGYAVTPESMLKVGSPITVS